MKHEHHDIFISAVHSKNKLQLVFFSKKEGDYTSREVAPTDFDGKYYFQDLNNDHPFSKFAKEIHSMSLLHESFDPELFLKKTPKWSISRDWGWHS